MSALDRSLCLHFDDKSVIGFLAVQFDDFLWAGDLNFKLTVVVFFVLS